jgi:hypothetical protein
MGCIHRCFAQVSVDCDGGASVVPPEDGHLTPETCRGLRHNKVFVIVKVKVY